ncbi:hypothetical protein FOL47_000886 [Perkinsus chesapeaki]|uniref:OTU domain-containing protein n=1 Tax=Perkinsus chesapeaki TaxID=330153 RepID=A0A7J6MKT5_PERCH|nr:hypothetical protein FOL47_000886 [Perkinsus chesapeaki]
MSFHLLTSAGITNRFVVCDRLLVDPCRGILFREVETEQAAAGEVVLVTGGSGFIGSNLVEDLLELDYRVRVFDNLVTGNIQYLPLDHPRLEFYFGDIMDRKELWKAMKGVTGIIHLAAASKVLPSLKNSTMATFNVNVNSVGTANVLEVAQQSGTVQKVVFAASSTYYGNQDLPYRESDHFAPSSPYSASKAMGELQMQTFDKIYNLPTVSLRFFMVYGPRQPRSGAYAIVAGVFAGQKERGEPLTVEGGTDKLMTGVIVAGDGLQFRDFVHVKDISRGIVLAYQNERVREGQPINLGSGEARTVQELADLVSSNQRRLPPRKNDLRGTLADTCRAKDLLGWSIRRDFRTEMGRIVKDTLAGKGLYLAKWFEKPETLLWLEKKIPGELVGCHVNRGKDDVLALTASEGKEEPNRSSNRFLDIFRCGHREARPSEASSGSTAVSRSQSDVAKARFPILDPELVDLTKFHREPVAGDNSCLFTAVIRSLKLNGMSTRDLRGIVARTIEANPERYTEAVLEQPPKKYSKWICKDTSWGGYIELSILAPHFGVQINTIGIMTGHFYKYPQDVSENTPCVYLLHDGAHYDYVASQSLVDDSRVSIFSSSDARVAKAAKGVADELRKRKQFTDFGGFTLQCQECFALVIGQAAVMPRRMQIVAIRRLVEAFGPDHSEWRLWLEEVSKGMSSSSTKLSTDAAAEALLSLYRIRDHNPAVTDRIMAFLSDQYFTTDKSDPQHIVALIEAWGSIDTSVWDAKALRCLEKSVDEVLDPIASTMTTFQLVTLCDCLSKMVQRGLEIDPMVVAKLAEFLRTNMRELTDTQQLPVLSHAFAIMLSAPETAKENKEVVRMLSVLCETAKTVWLPEFSLNELSALLTTLHQCGAPAQELARASVPEFVRLLEDDSQEITGLILGSITLPLLKLTGRVEETVVAAVARRLGQGIGERTKRLIGICCEHLTESHRDYEPRTLVFSLHMLSLFYPDQSLLRDLLPVTEKFPINLQTMILGICERGKDAESAEIVLSRIAKVKCRDPGEAARILRSISRLPSELWQRYAVLVKELSKCALKDTRSSSRTFAVCLALAKMKPSREEVSELMEKVMRAIIAAEDKLDLVDAATATSILVRLTGEGSSAGTAIMLPSRFCDAVTDSVISCILRATSGGYELPGRDLDRIGQCLSGLAKLQLRPADSDALELCISYLINRATMKTARHILSILHSAWKLDLKKATEAIEDNAVGVVSTIDAVRTIYCLACLGVPSARIYLSSALRPELTSVESSQLITALAAIHLDCPRIGRFLNIEHLTVALDL